MAIRAGQKKIKPRFMATPPSSGIFIKLAALRAVFYLPLI
ncbi:hypothetical protein DET1062 [Dehalococcoides mccartyi 195]|uniref:Uncharacterized protein n=1 Tax=Dehalococcoides mccartyi (strain ATCC BAA-2266 / KCTC 15142 / 195) TaxID=243164 RepID=Q3Z7M2_DEHM1|nr:hypothetical protein DET1062 [Dehalococcoides mccartyi 195]